jgi:hypothetical protein
VDRTQYGFPVLERFFTQPNRLVEPSGGSVIKGKGVRYTEGAGVLRSIFGFLKTGYFSSSRMASSIRPAA